MARIGLKDVAALAGVSVSTVSRVLRGIPVKDGMAVQVRDAAHKLGYQPNGLAQALRAGKSGTLGLLIPDISNPWLAELASALEEACRLSGIGLILCNSGNRPDQEEMCLDLLWKHRVDGVFLVSVRGQAPASLSERARADWPVVAFDRSYAGPGIDVVMADNVGGAQALVNHLVSIGRRNIAQIVSGTGLAAGIDRRVGVDDALRRHGLRTADLYVGDFSYASGLAGAEHFIGRGAPAIDAIVAANDLMAIGALRHCVESGLEVPGDVAIAGFDDMSISSWTSPSLTTVRQDPELLATAALDLLLSRLDDAGLPPRTVTVPCTLKVRGSTHPGASDQP
ncbi:LacI family DNA-binding transcriptional regulator [Homoserinimonas sp. OAct 916]|uniref:LacI family DNA-binding transcriptional regulator n=1 Tax=Homoserinimonas sp. OAct 916 TaxID=2211450 RepID=UPI000DBE4215|nr:LacI family DNA-binding transcriptional regulator [Homoserinimonas sp. OAct 916]